MWNEKDLSRLHELVAEDYTLHAGGGTFSGRDGMRAIGQQWYGPFPDLRVDVLDQVADETKIADYLLFTGHHTGTAFHPGLFRSMGLPPIPASARASSSPRRASRASRTG